MKNNKLTMTTDAIQINTLNVFREQIFTLSEIDIEKSVFNQWKKGKIIDKLFNNRTRSWNRFSIREIAILYIVDILWQRNIDDQKIKEVINLLIGEDLSKQIVNKLLQENTYLQIEDFITYVAIQKKVNPNLPVISNIEALMISSMMKLNKPHSLIVTENENFLISSFKDLFFSKHGFIFSNLFLNIPLQDITRKIFLKEINNNQIQKLIKKGYPIEVLNEIFKPIDETAATNIELAGTIATELSDYLEIS